MTALLINENVSLLWKNLCSSFKLVEAAGGVVLKENKLLFIHRLGKWDLPKGKMEGEEGIEQCNATSGSEK